MTVAATIALIAAISDLLTEVDARGIEVRYVAAGRIMIVEDGTVEILDAEAAADWMLDVAVLGEEVNADPEPFHPDTRAAYGIKHFEVITLGNAVDVTYEDRRDVPACAAQVSADCTGEGTAYAGRCLPCDFDIAAREEMMHAEAFAAGRVRY